MFYFIRPLRPTFRTSLLFVSYARPLVHLFVYYSYLLCSVSSIAFSLSSISMHVFSYWFFSTEINLDSNLNLALFPGLASLLNLAPPSEIEERIGVGAQHIS